MCSAAAPDGKPATRSRVVIGPDHAAVADEIKRLRPDAPTFIQRERLGTAHAVLAAREAIVRGADDVLVAFGDTPLISAATLRAAARAAERRRGAGRARLSRRRSDRLWPAAGRGRPADGDPRACRRQRGGARDQTLQCRRDGLRRPQGAAKSSKKSDVPTPRASIIWSMRWPSSANLDGRRS